MLRSLKDLEYYHVTASDGDIGDVVRFLLDDERWTIRYLVVKTGSFLKGREVLISPISFRLAEWSTQRFHLALTMDKIKGSPGIDLDLPVSRQNERRFLSYYGYPNYWGLAGIWGKGMHPATLAAAKWRGESDEASDHVSGDAHLRSDHEIRGYHIRGSDEAIGHVEDFIVDDETWAVRYLVIDTSNWWFGKKVLVAPQWARSISWRDRLVHVAMTRQAIKDSPEWNETTATINRDYEARLYDYYGHPVYWGEGARLLVDSPAHSKNSTS